MNRRTFLERLATAIPLVATPLVLLKASAPCTVWTTDRIDGPDVLDFSKVSYWFHPMRRSGDTHQFVIMAFDTDCRFIASRDVQICSAVASIYNHGMPDELQYQVWKAWVECIKMVEFKKAGCPKDFHLSDNRIAIDAMSLNSMRLSEVTEPVELKR